jgi:hypothetical protein
VTKLIGLALAVLLPISCFEAYALHTQGDAKVPQRGGEFLTGLPTATPSITVSTTATSRAPALQSSSVTSTTSTPRGATATMAPSVAAPTSRAVPRTTTPAAAVRPSVAASGSGVVLPRTGSYGLAVTGHEKASFGPVGLCEGDLPDATQLVVSAASGESPTSRNLDVRLYPGNAGRHDERHLYRYTSDGVYLDYEQAVVTCFGVKQSTDLPFTPPQLSIKFPLAVGSRWTNRGGDQDRTEEATSTVVRRDAVTVGGRSWPVYVVDTSVTMTGSESGHRARTVWWSPDLALALRLREQITASSSGGTYDCDYTATVTSLPGASSDPLAWTLTSNPG